MFLPIDGQRVERAGGRRGSRGEGRRPRSPEGRSGSKAPPEVFAKATRSSNFGPVRATALHTDPHGLGWSTHAVLPSTHTVPQHCRVLTAAALRCTQTRTAGLGWDRRPRIAHERPEHTGAACSARRGAPVEGRGGPQGSGRADATVAPSFRSDRAGAAADVPTQTKPKR